MGEEADSDEPVEGPVGSKSEESVDGGGVDGGTDTGSSTLEAEEDRMEDSNALQMLIHARLSGEEAPQSKPGEPMAAGEDEVAGGDAVDEALDRAAPAAGENMQLSGAACLRRLKAEGVSYERPRFETPRVGTPVLLSGPVADVQIRPRWPSGNREKEVMDCHLALALVEVAHQAKDLGVVEINFYSTYRPLRPPPKKCPKGKRRKRCLRAKRKYQRELRSKSPSQHRVARAIDIRFLQLEDGRTLDVLEHFDRRSGKDPCSYEPDTEEAKMLSKFVCGLWRTRTFNIMLTPNANKAHHNHFHFDLSAKAKWYIIR